MIDTLNVRFYTLIIVLQKVSASVVISVDIHLNYTQWEVKQSNKLNEVDSEERSSREVTGTSAWVFFSTCCLFTH